MFDIRCRCFVLNNGKEYLRTFQPKADEGVFLVYSMNSKAYRVYNKRQRILKNQFMLYSMKVTRKHPLLMNFQKGSRNL